MSEGTSLGRGADLAAALRTLVNAQPLLTLAVLVFLSTFFTLDARALWFSDEVRHANVFEHLAKADKWLVLYLNGEAYPDKPPLYFWSLWPLYKLLGGLKPGLFFAAAALWGYAFLVSVYLLARQVAGLSRDQALGAALLLLATPSYQVLLHYARMDFMFATFIVLTQIAFWHGLNREGFSGYTLLGFFLAGIAVLTKGHFGPIFAVLTVASYLAWSGRLRRILCWDVWLGGLLLLAMVAAWLGAAWLVEGRGFIENILGQQVVARTFNTFHHLEPFYYYLIALPLAWLPWALLPLFSAGSVLKKGFWVDVRANIRTSRQHASGQTYIWLALISGFVFLSSVSIKVLVYILPLLAPLAILSIGALERLSDRMRLGFLGLVALPYVLSALVLFGIDLSQAQPWLEGASWLGLGLLLGAALIWWSRHGGLSLNILAFSLAALCMVPGLFGRLLPSMDWFMSPKAAAEIIRDYRQQGYQPLSLRIYSGSYSYYAQGPVTEVYEYVDILKALEQHPRLIVAMPRKTWHKWQGRPAGAKVINEHLLVDDKMLLALIERDSP
jgi:4-amino-4-deoxy-L-arabinose transferase-like glycosyltransferase